MHFLAFALVDHSAIQLFDLFCVTASEATTIKLRPQIWAMVVAQLVERSLPTPEVRRSNRVIGKIYNKCIEKTKKVIKRAGVVHFFKKDHNILRLHVDHWTNRLVLFPFQNMTKILDVACLPFYAIMKVRILPSKNLGSVRGTLARN